MKKNKIQLLDSAFFNHSTLKVAKNILDKYIITERNGKKCGGRIVEVEAYLGQKDKASHAACGITKRNKLMYGKSGRIYIYYIYGNYNMFNIVCEEEGKPGAILFRAIEPEIGIETMIRRRKKDDVFDLTSGPAKLVQALGINLKDNGKKIPCKDIYIYEDSNKRRMISSGPRVGISKSKNFNYRFFIKNNRFLSK